MKFAGCAVALLFCLDLRAQVGTGGPSRPPAAMAQAAGNAGVHGFVVDGAGGPVSGALVMMRCAGGGAERTVHSRPDGGYDFTGVPAGAFSLGVSQSGFVTRTVSGTLEEGASLQIAQIALAMTAGPADAEVYASVHDIAEAQLKVEEQQRVLGIFPNFYISYIPDAAPLSKGQKLSLAVEDLVDPADFVESGAIAGFEQAANSFSGYGQGAAGYAKRYGATFADGATGVFFANVVFPVLLRQDPRYFWKGTGTKRERAKYAISRVLICKGDNGRWQPNYSNVLGNLASAGMSNLYYPASDRSGVGLTLRNVAIGEATSALVNLYQEFFSHGMTPSAKKMSEAEAAAGKR